MTASTGMQMQAAGSYTRFYSKMPLHTPLTLRSLCLALLHDSDAPSHAEICFWIPVSSIELLQADARMYDTGSRLEFQRFPSFRRVSALHLPSFSKNEFTEETINSHSVCGALLLHFHVIRSGGGERRTSSFLAGNAFVDRLDERREGDLAVQSPP